MSTKQALLESAMVEILKVKHSQPYRVKAGDFIEDVYQHANVVASITDKNHIHHMSNRFIKDNFSKSYRSVFVVTKEESHRYIVGIK